MHFRRNLLGASRDPKAEIDLVKDREETEGDVAMESKKLEVVTGSGNVFRDLGHKHAEADQFKAILAAEIIKTLDREGITVRDAHGAPELRQRTSRAPATRILDGSLLIV